MDKRTNDHILAGYFKVDSIKADNRQLAHRFLLGAAWSAILTPVLFYLGFGSVGWFAICFTIFLVVLNLLFALGLYFQSKPAYHTEVPLHGTLSDRLGAFWLVACAFGPFFGWVITAFTPGERNWWWQYAARALLGVVLPLVTMLPLVAFVRGRSALIALPLLVVITALPILSCWWVLGDLHDGANVRRVTISRIIGSVGLACQPSGEHYDLPVPALAVSPRPENSRSLRSSIPLGSCPFKKL